MGYKLNYCNISQVTPKLGCYRYTAVNVDYLIYYFRKKIQQCEQFNFPSHFRFTRSYLLRQFNTACVLLYTCIFLFLKKK